MISKDRLLDILLSRWVFWILMAGAITLLILRNFFSPALDNSLLAFILGVVFYIQGRLGRLEGRVTAVEDRLTNLEGRFTTLERMVVVMDGRVAGIEKYITLLPTTEDVRRIIREEIERALRG